MFGTIGLGVVHGGDVGHGGGVGHSKVGKYVLV